MADEEARRHLISIASQAQHGQSDVAKVEVPTGGIPQAVSAEHVLAYHVARATYLLAEAVSTGAAAIADAITESEFNR